MSIIKDLALEQAQSERKRAMERLKREGHEFIKVILTGANRIYAVKDILVQEQQNITNGEIGYTTSEGDSILEGVWNNETSRYEAYILDCDYNRFLLAKNAKTLGIEIEDKKITKQIELLKDKPMPMPTTREEQIEEQINRLRKEQHKIEEEKRKMAELEKKEDELFKRDQKRQLELVSASEGV